MSLLVNLRHLQTAIARMKAERDHVQQLIHQYDQLLNVHLGPLLAQLEELQQTLTTKRAAQSRRRSEQDALTVNSQQLTANSSGRFHQTPSPNPSAQTPSLQPQTLRKLYRRAVSLAHPDLFAGDPDREARATEVMGQLNAAYAREDTEAVRQWLDDLRDGLPFLDLPGTEPDAEALARILTRLTQTRDALLLELVLLQKNRNYQLMSDETIDLTAHLGQLEQQCRLQIEWLHQQLAP